MKEILKIDQYDFEAHSLFDVELHSIRDKRIVGSYINKRGVIVPFTVDFTGEPQMYAGPYSIRLTPYDKFADIKRAERDGAVIEFLDETDLRVSKWMVLFCPISSNYPLSSYRIKDGISIKQWDKHKEAIKAYWDGYEIEYKFKNEDWDIAGFIPTWSIENHIYRKKESIEMTIKQIEKQLNIKNLKIVKEGCNE